MPTKSEQKNILEELGLDTLPQETQVKLLTRMTESILKRVTIKVLEKLSEPERDEFYGLQESGDTEKITEFLKSKIPNYDNMVLKEIKAFTKDMKEKVADLRETVSA